MESQNFEPFISLEIHTQFLQALLCDPEQQQASWGSEQNE
jgi:hypothetical protein